MNFKVVFSALLGVVATTSFGQTYTASTDFSSLSTYLQSSPENGITTGVAATPALGGPDADFNYTLSGYTLASPLNQAVSSATLSGSTGTRLLYDSVAGGLTVGSSPTQELVNNGSLPTTLLEISDLSLGFDNPQSRATNVDLLLKSANISSTNGFLIYGGDEYTGHMTLLDHGYLTNGSGNFDANQALLSQYNAFYITGDNGLSSSVTLAGANFVKETPEPQTYLMFGLAGIGLFVRRKRKAFAH